MRLRSLAIECHGDPQSKELSFLDRACSRLVDTWKQGKNEIVLSGFAWHTAVHVDGGEAGRAQSSTRGDGVTAGRWRKPNGNTHTVFGFGFLDSHKNAELQVGYAWSTFWGPRDGIQPGLGYTAMIVQRPDIANGIPFPAVLPLFSLRYGQATLVTTYIPNLGGGINNGSVLYVFGRVTIE